MSPDMQIWGVVGFVGLLAAWPVLWRRNRVHRDEVGGEEG